MTDIYYTVNSGLYFTKEKTGVFIDGIHGGLSSGYTPVAENTLRDCINRNGTFSDLRALLFTHCHDDHFDPDAVRKIRQQNGPVADDTHTDREGGLQCGLIIYAPGKFPAPAGSVLPDNDTLKMKIGPFDIAAVRTIHDGREPLCLEPHVSYIINTSDETFFAAGDAAFTENDAARILKLCSHRIKYVFADAYQLLLDHNRQFLKALDPSVIALIHRPLPKDDAYNARLLYDTAVKRYPADMPKLILPEFYSYV